MCALTALLVAASTILNFEPPFHYQEHAPVWAPSGNTPSSQTLGSDDCAWMRGIRVDCITNGWEEYTYQFSDWRVETLDIGNTWTILHNYALDLAAVGVAMSAADYLPKFTGRIKGSTTDYNGGSITYFFLDPQNETGDFKKTASVPTNDGRGPEDSEHLPIRATTIEQADPGAGWHYMNSDGEFNTAAYLYCVAVRDVVSCQTNVHVISIVTNKTVTYSSRLTDELHASAYNTYAGMIDRMFFFAEGESNRWTTAAYGPMNRVNFRFDLPSNSVQRVCLDDRGVKTNSVSRRFFDFDRVGETARFFRDELNGGGTLGAIDRPSWPRKSNRYYLGARNGLGREWPASRGWMSSIDTIAGMDWERTCQYMSLCAACLPTDGAGGACWFVPATNVIHRGSDSVSKRLLDLGRFGEFGAHMCSTNTEYWLADDYIPAYNPCTVSDVVSTNFACADISVLTNMSRRLFADQLAAVNQLMAVTDRTYDIPTRPRQTNAVECLYSRGGLVGIASAAQVDLEFDLQNQTLNWTIVDDDLPWEIVDTSAVTNSVTTNMIATAANQLAFVRVARTRTALAGASGVVSTNGYQRVFPLDADASEFLDQSSWRTHRASEHAGETIAGAELECLGPGYWMLVLCVVTYDEQGTPAYMWYQFYYQDPRFYVEADPMEVDAVADIGRSFKTCRLMFAGEDDAYGHPFPGLPVHPGVTGWNYADVRMLNGCQTGWISGTAQSLSVGMDIYDYFHREAPVSFSEEFTGYWGMASEYKWDVVDLDERGDYTNEVKSIYGILDGILAGRAENSTGGSPFTAPFGHINLTGEAIARELKRVKPVRSGSVPLSPLSHGHSYSVGEFRFDPSVANQFGAVWDNTNAFVSVVGWSWSPGVRVESGEDSNKGEHPDFAGDAYMQECIQTDWKFPHLRGSWTGE